MDDMKQVADIPIVARENFVKTYFTDSTRQPRQTDAAPYIDVHQRQDIRKSILPHRLDFYMIAMINAGKGSLVFGSKSFKIKERMLVFSGPNVISSWKSNGSYLDGHYCTFSEDYYNIGFVHKHFLSCLPFFQIDQKPVLCLTDDQRSVTSAVPISLRGKL